MNASSWCGTEQRPDTWTDLPDVLVVLSNELARHGVSDMLRWTSGVGSMLSAASPCEAMPLLECGTDVLVAEVAADEDTRTLLDLAVSRRIKVLLILPQIDAETVELASAIPADGLLVQADLSVDTLGKALRSVLDDEFSVPSNLGRYLMARARGHAYRPDPVVRLTPREKEVMSLLVDGLANKQIARVLSISENGVKRHVTSLLAKLNCPNRTLAVARALRAGLV
ncbi:MAG: helix-turn-helix domain-containing protein [Actinoallomurus sp.]